MDNIQYIRVDIDILRLPIKDKSKLLLGLIKSFNSKGLIISNPKLGELIGCSEDYVSKLLKDLDKYITIINPKSRYRRIIYSGHMNDVDDSTPAKSTECDNLLRTNGLVTPSFCPDEPSKSTDITKGTEGITDGGNKRTKFTIPTIDEVIEYAGSIDYDIDAEYFIDKYNATGWKLSSGKPMNNWKTTVVTWKKKDRDNPIGPKPVERDKDGLTPREKQRILMEK